VVKLSCARQKISCSFIFVTLL